MSTHKKTNKNSFESTKNNSNSHSFTLSTKNQNNFYDSISTTSNCTQQFPNTFQFNDRKLQTSSNQSSSQSILSHFNNAHNNEMLSLEKIQEQKRLTFRTQQSLKVQQPTASTRLKDIDDIQIINKQQYQSQVANILNCNIKSIGRGNKKQKLLLKNASQVIDVKTNRSISSKYQNSRANEINQSINDTNINLNIKRKSNQKSFINQINQSKFITNEKQNLQQVSQYCQNSNIVNHQIFQGQISRQRQKYINQKFLQQQKQQDKNNYSHRNFYKDKQRNKSKRKKIFQICLNKRYNHNNFQNSHQKDNLGFNHIKINSIQMKHFFQDDINQKFKKQKAIKKVLNYQQQQHNHPDNIQNTKINYCPHTLCMLKSLQIIDKMTNNKSNQKNQFQRSQLTNINQQQKVNMSRRDLHYRKIISQIKTQIDKLSNCTLQQFIHGSKDKIKWANQNVLNLQQKLQDQQYCNPDLLQQSEKLSQNIYSINRVQKKYIDFRIKLKQLRTQMIGKINSKNSEKLKILKMISNMIFKLQEELNVGKKSLCIQKLLVDYFQRQKDLLKQSYEVISNDYRQRLKTE